jgi:uncharacterized protein (TIGR00290 family)
MSAPMGQRLWLAWSSGKDSAWALHVLRQDPRYQVDGLFCTVNREHDRVSLHGVRVSLLRQQAESAGLPLRIVGIPSPCSDAGYADIMAALVETAAGAGVEGFAFGDLLLEDVRRYREARLRGTGIRALFPLWGRSTASLARAMLAGGLKARLTCLDPGRLPERLAGREYDATLLDELPATVDPCGENGEFHSIAYDVPMFRWPIAMRRGETLRRDGFVYTDWLPVAGAAAG